MPLVLWPVQPNYLYRNNDIKDDSDVLRSQRIHALSNIMRQLGSISMSVEEIFVGISADIESIQMRTQELSFRITELRDNIDNVYDVDTNLDPNQKDWSMNIKIGAPTVARNTLPEPIEKLYNSCVPNPPLDRLDKFNKNGVKCMNSYSRPEFFFEEWINAFDKDIALKQEKKMKKREEMKAARAEKKAAQVKTPTPATTPTTTSTTISQSLIDSSKVEASPSSKSKSRPNFKPKFQKSSNKTSLSRKDTKSSSSSKTSIPSVMSNDVALELITENDDSTFHFKVDETLTESYTSFNDDINIPTPLNAANVIPFEDSSQSNSQIKSHGSGYKVNEIKTSAPPPAPPPVAILQVSKPAPPKNVPNVASNNTNDTLKPPPAAASGNMDLLSAIRLGKGLKSVSVNENKHVEQFAGNDVASILARRIQLAGDSDSDISSQENEDDDWD